MLRFFCEFDAEAFRGLVSAFYDRARRSPKPHPRGELDELKRMGELAPTLVHLKNSKLRDRHWRQLGERMGVQLCPWLDSTTTLADVLGSKLFDNDGGGCHRSVDFVKRMVAVAEAEAKVEEGGWETGKLAGLDVEVRTFVGPYAGHMFHEKWKPVRLNGFYLLLEDGDVHCDATEVECAGQLGPGYRVPMVAAIEMMVFSGGDAKPQLLGHSVRITSTDGDEEEDDDEEEEGEEEGEERGAGVPCIFAELFKREYTPARTYAVYADGSCRELFQHDAASQTARLRLALEPQHPGQTHGFKLKVKFVSQTAQANIRHGDKTAQAFRQMRDRFRKQAIAFHHRGGSNKCPHYMAKMAKTFGLADADYLRRRNLTVDELHAMCEDCNLKVELPDACYAGYIRVLAHRLFQDEIEMLLRKQQKAEEVRKKRLAEEELAAVVAVVEDGLPLPPPPPQKMRRTTTTTIDGCDGEIDLV